MRSSKQMTHPRQWSTASALHGSSNGRHLSRQNREVNVVKLAKVKVKCCFQTCLRLTAIPLWWWYLYNSVSAGERSKGKQYLANKSITPPLCPQRQTANSLILFYLGVMQIGDKAKAGWPPRAVTLKQQAMIIQCSGKAASDNLVWNQHKAYDRSAHLSFPGVWPYLTMLFLLCRLPLQN